jgi:hypothetical protein
MAFFALALGTGAGLALTPTYAATASVALVMVFVIALRPAVGAYLLIIGTLLLAGVERGTLLPLLRPNEGLLLVVSLGVLAHLLLRNTSVSRPVAAPSPTRLDAAIVLLAVSGSLAPLAWMVVREREITQDDLLYALQLWKYYAVFLIVRTTVRTPREVKTTLWVTMGTSAVVAAVAILQALQLFGTQELIVQIYSPEGDAGDFALNRGSSTLGSTFAVADVMVFSLAIAGALLVRKVSGAPIIVMLMALFLLGAIAAGQFSGVIGLAVAALAFGLVTARLGRVLTALGVAAIAAGIALQPVIQRRLDTIDSSTGLPVSWGGRLDNLNTYFWPELSSDLNWLTGVRPAGRIDAPEPWRDWIYIESGHTWLMWTGGIVFLLAFFVFLVVATRVVLPVARRRLDSIGAAAVASFVAIGVIAVLMTLDPHLTLRGAGELAFTLLALSLADRDPEVSGDATMQSGRTPSQATSSRNGWR